MGKNHNSKKKVVRKPEPEPKKNKQGTNYLEKEARYLTRNYTNQLIRKQIENDNFFFFFYILLLVVAAILIFAVGGEGGRVGGISIAVIVFILMIITGTFNMPKHIRPACSSKRYTPQEIDSMANDPETTWNEIIRAFVTPTTLIGINKGLTVVDYDDIESFKARKRWHSERYTTIDSDARRFGKVSTHYYGHLKYNNRLDWYTYIIVIKTHSGKRLRLTETVYEDACEELNAILEAKRSKRGRDFMETKSANLYARIEPDVKEQEEILATPEISAMRADALDVELEKGYADMKAGRTKSSAQVFADIRKENN